MRCPIEKRGLSRCELQPRATLVAPCRSLTLYVSFDILDCMNNNIIPTPACEPTNVEVPFHFYSPAILQDDCTLAVPSAIKDILVKTHCWGIASRPSVMR